MTQMDAQIDKLTPEEQKRLQRTLAELEQSRGAIEAMRGQLNALGNTLNELMLTTETVKHIKELKPDTEILVPVGSDSFVKAKVTETDRVISGIGADVAAERSAEDAASALEEQQKALEEALERARAEMERLTTRIEELRPEAQQLLAKSREEQP